MSPKNPPIIVGLAAPGLLWLATSVAFGQDPPPAPPGLPTPASTPSSTSPKAFRMLLLTNGKVIPGDIVEDTSAGQYRLRQNGGSVSYPRIMVLTAGQSIEDLYRFQVFRLPEGDPDERMKLARWCLTEHLMPQAREQLEAIQAMCPNDAEVKRMIYNLSSTADRPAPLDEGVRRTSGEAPATLDPRVIIKAQKRFNALPEIFDLPPAQAVKRANEFADYVQPVLQQSCARCHNEKYQGDFQLVEVRTRRDQANPDNARANLDATLRLINPDDPARSPLLSAGLVPHGDSKAAIFRGANDKNYQVLSQWNRSLRVTSATVAGPRPGARGFGDGNVSRTGLASPEDAPGEGFASERSARSAASRPPGADSLEKFDSPFPTPPPRAFVQQFDENAEFVTAPGDRPEFPAPFSVGGAAANRPPTPKAAPKAKAARPSAPGTPANPSSPTPSVSKRTAKPAGPGSVIVTTDDPNELPGMDQPRYPPKAEASDEDEEADKIDKKKAKPIDGALLEKVMKSRNGGGTP
jgi:hypothetical protein